MKNERCIYCESIIEHQNDDFACNSCLLEINGPIGRRSFVGPLIFVLVMVIIAALC